MASIESQLAALRRRAAKDDVEVEHLTKFAAVGDGRAVAVIRELQRRHNWSHSNRDGEKHVVPLGRWADVVCAYLEGGCDALVAYARQPEEDSLSFAVSVLSDLKSAPALLAVEEVAGGLAAGLPERLEACIKVADVINAILSLKNPVPIYPATEVTLRGFLHVLSQHCRSQSHRATVVCALRGVGDAESIRIIEGLPPFTDAWAGLEARACKVIRKRLRRGKSGKRDEA